MEQHVWKHRRKLRWGYTTGSCAAAATKAATAMLLGGELVEQVMLETPKGICLYLDVEQIEQGDGYVQCKIKKDSGDDPDITDGIDVYARVERRREPGVHLCGGEGVGVVTRKGLNQPVGEAAINTVPRQMITGAAIEQCRRYDYQGGLLITISMPQGVHLAAQTFNPRLGIEGGLSVLGTTGIVEPMSEKALLDTIYLEMKMLKESGHQWCYVVPGNYGSDFLTEVMNFDPNLAVKCSNYIGETIDMAHRLEMKGLVFIGHVGKFIKLAAGVMNTHSRQADGRAEVFAAHAALNGASPLVTKALMSAATTIEMIDLVTAAGVKRQVIHTVMERIGYHLHQRAGDELWTGAVMFSKEHGILGTTAAIEVGFRAIEKEQK